MTYPKSVILFNGTKPTKPVLKFIQRQIEKWLLQNEQQMPPSEENIYYVSVERPTDLSPFACSIRIQNESSAWEGHSHGKTLQEAFLQALKHMRVGILEPLPSIMTSSSVEDAA